MKKIAFLLFSCLFHFLVSAQLKEIFYDDFSSNKNKWPEGQFDGLYFKVENGKYIIDCGPTKALYPQILFGIDSTKDFSISVNIKEVKVSDVSAAGLVFGSNRSTYFTFAITSAGSFYLFEVSNNKISKMMIPFTESKQIKRDDNVTNNLAVRKNGSSWSFYINDSLVKKIASNKLNGPYVGVASMENTKSEFDDLKIAGTPVVTSGTLCQLLPLIYESAKDKFSYITSVKVKPSDSTKFFTCLTIDSNKNGRVFKEDFIYDFFIGLKTITKKEEAVQYLKSLIAGLRKCLPAYVFTEEKDDKGEIRYNITEKIKGKGPEMAMAYFEIYVASDGLVDVNLHIGIWVK